jgi:hypothetical protein
MALTFAPNGLLPKSLLETSDANESVLLLGPPAISSYSFVSNGLLTPDLGYTSTDESGAGISPPPTVAGPFHLSNAKFNPIVDQLAKPDVVDYSSSLARDRHVFHCEGSSPSRTVVH